MTREGYPVSRRDVVLPTAALGGAVAVWYLAAVAIPPYLLPSPAAVVSLLAADPELYVRNAVSTLQKIVYGGLVGIGTGFLLALGVSTVGPLRRAVMPYLVAIRVLPKIAIAPALLIYLGTGMETAVLFVALITFFPMVLSTVAGLERTPDPHLDLLRSVDAGPLRTFLAVRLRFALPDLFAGIKQSITLAVVGTIVAEWVVVDSGLGYLMLIAAENVRPDIMLAALFVLLLEGLLLYGLVSAAKRWAVGDRAAVSRSAH